MARLLVIEDNPANLELMTYLLHAFGHDTLTAGDGEEGVALAESEDVDLIVCDVHLPRMDGYEVAKRLKAHPALCKVPLVAVTALAMVGDRDKVLAAGFDGYIAKPIDPAEFVRQVETFLPSSATPSIGASATTMLAPNPPPPSVQRARILMVDDSRTNRELATASLEPFGYQVTQASSVAEALALLADADYDLILSDVHMPSQDGFAFLTQVRADARLGAIPFLLVSATIWGERDRLRGLELGATRVLLRPAEPLELLQEVVDCLAPAKESGLGDYPGR